MRAATHSGPLGPGVVKRDVFRYAAAEKRYRFPRNPASGFAAQFAQPLGPALERTIWLFTCRP